MADAHTSLLRPLGLQTLRLTWITLVVALFLLAAGTAPALGQAETPSLRFVHVSPGTPPVNAMVEGQPIAKALAYGATSNRLSFPGGTARLQVSAAEDPNRVLLDAPIELPLDGPATVLLIGRLSGTPSLAALVLSDYLGQSTQDRTRVRFVNAEVGGGAVSLISGQASTLFEDIG